MDIQDQKSWAQFDRAFDRILTAALRADTVPSDEVTLADAGLDSLGTLWLMMDLEGEFGSMWPLENLVASARGWSVGQLREATRNTLWRDQS
jgi:acyl carrier protein